MNFLWTFDRLAAGLIIFAGFITLAFAAQGSGVPNLAPTKASDAPVASGRMPMDQVAAGVSETTTAADSLCEKQNWPYYSKECLRGEVGGSAPRQIHLQSAAVNREEPTPVLASTDTAERKPVEFRHVAETPRRRKLRRAPSYASRPLSRPQVVQFEGSEPLPAVTW
jgi:hypothetical protein